MSYTDFLNKQITTLISTIVLNFIMLLYATVTKFIVSQAISCLLYRHAREGYLLIIKIINDLYTQHRWGFLATKHETPPRVHCSIAA